MGIEELMLDRAEKKGIKKGIKTGKKTGLKVGMKTGLKVGLKEGERRKMIETAIEMNKDSIPAAQISRYTKLTIQEIEKL